MIGKETPVRIEPPNPRDPWADGATRPLRLTKAAQVYRTVLAIASVTLGVSPFLPWFSIDGSVYTLIVADRAPVVPAAVVLMAAAGLANAVWRPRRAKAAGRWIGALALAANIVGFVVAALSDPLVASTEPMYRIREWVSAWLTWGGCVAFGSSLVILVGALSAWKPLVSLTPARLVDGQAAGPSANRPTRRGQGRELLPKLPPIDTVIGHPRRP